MLTREKINTEVEMLEIFFTEKTLEKNGCYFTYHKTESGILVSSEHNGTVLDVFEIVYEEIPSNTKFSIPVNDQGCFMNIVDVDKMNSNRYSSNSVYSSAFKDIQTENNRNVNVSDINFFKSIKGDFILLFMGVLYDETTYGQEFSQSFSSLLVSRYPEYKEKRDSIYIKRNFTSTLDPNDTLAYIEAQVDFLTYAVLRLVDQHPEIIVALNNDISFDEFKIYLEKSSVMNIKPIEDCIGELTNKINLRKSQEQYYENKFSDVSL